METHTMTDTHSNPPRRMPPRREQPHQAAHLICTKEFVATPRTWPTRGLSMDLDQFELQVFGAVRQSLDLNWSTLKALPPMSIDADLDSRSVRRPRRTWTGASLHHVLRLADVERAAIRVTLYSEGGYYTRFALHELLRKGGVLAYEVDGRPLTRSEGGPVRLVMPRLDPWRCSKWVRGISVEDDLEF